MSLSNYGRSKLKDLINNLSCLRVTPVGGCAPRGVTQAMKKYLTKAMVFFEDDEGAAAIEYALLASLIAVVIATAVGLFGTKLASSFESSASKLFPGEGDG